MTLKHLRSSTVDKRPQPSGMADGQLAINTASGSPGLFFKDTNGSLVKIGPVHVGSGAPNASPASGGTTGNSLGEQWLDTSAGGYVFKIWDGGAWRSETGEFVNASGDTMTGSLVMGPSADLVFEGSVDDGFETTITVVNPTADRTITFPNVTGTVVTTGDSGSVTSTMIANGTIVDADVNASAAIAGTKVSPNFGSQTVQTTGIFSAAGGSAAAPSIAFTGDTNTGIYSPGADQVAISTNGTGRLFVDASGNVSIVQFPQTGGVYTKNLTVAGTNASMAFRANSAGVYTDQGIFFLIDGVNYSHIYNEGVGQLVFRTGSSLSERLRITSAGRVGIGTSVPTSALEINGTITIGTGGTQTYQAGVIGFTDANWGCLSRPPRAGAIGAYGFQSFAGTTRVVITDDGKVGIGVTSPSTLLHVEGGDILLKDSTPIFTMQPTADTQSARIRYINTAGTDKALIKYDYVDDSLAYTTGVTERLRITSAGRVGIGTASPADFLHVMESSASAAAPTGASVAQFERAGNAAITISTADAGQASINFGDTASSTVGSINYNHSDNSLNFGTASSERLRITSAGLVGIGTSTPDALLTVNGVGAHGLGSASAPSFSFTGDLNTGIYSPGADRLAVATNGVGRLFVDASGNIGIGGSSAAAPLQINSSVSNLYTLFDDGVNARFTFLADTTKATIVTATAGSTAIEDLELRSAQHIFSRTAAIESARIDSSGRLLVGTSTASTVAGALTAKFQVQGTSVFDTGITNILWSADTAPAQLQLVKSRGASLGTHTVVQNNDTLGRITFGGSDGTNFETAAWIQSQVDGTPGTDDMPGRLVLSTTSDGSSFPTERMRISADGSVAIGVANPTATSYVYARADGGIVAYLDRLTDDGIIVAIRQGGVTEGTISVAGTTVSYNGAHLSRWSQIPGIDPYNKTVRPEILRGTVMSNLDEMCDWTCPESGDSQDNEQLNKTKISDVEGDKNVAGIFQAWDDDDDTWVNDFYLAMTGDFVIRIAAGTTVERGDLLMSAGDGTAKPQDDDIIRSKTIAKVTSTNVSCTYADGSYCVPCVLMAC